MGPSFHIVVTWESNLINVIGVAPRLNRVATGEKPYKCNVMCSAQLAQSGHVKMHIRTHTGEKIIHAIGVVPSLHGVIP